MIFQAAAVYRETMKSVLFIYLNFFYFFSTIAGAAETKMQPIVADLIQNWYCLRFVFVFLSENFFFPFSKTNKQKKKKNNIDSFIKGVAAAALADHHTPHLHCALALLNYQRQPLHLLNTYSSYYPHPLRTLRTLWAISLITQSLRRSAKVRELPLPWFKSHPN